MTLAPTESPLVATGLLPVDRAREVYWLRRGGATAVSLREGDELVLADPTGDGGAELTVLAGGRERLAAVGLRPDGPAHALRTMAGSPDAEAHRFLAGLRGAGLHAGEATCARILHGAAAGTSQRLVADREMVAVLAAPPGDPAAAELVLELHRAQPAPDPGERAELPPPLAEPRLDLRVDAATAREYEVRAGEWIQVIDVFGRQCSDFLAFHRDKLAGGRERGLDATVSRTLSGSAFPIPGLRGRFFDADMEPLVDVVQDTVGRHDTFALACQPRYYEDLGYPGHVNCTENFNRRLILLGIAPRAGWEALNLFYNTAFDADHLLVGDEPWSRPGDYVLMRAQSDLLCASSACPDDIDPSNGWEVTDVHVRVYSPEHRFAVAIAHRPDRDIEARLTRESAFHPRVAALSSNLAEDGGFWFAERFDGHGAVAEYWACRERVAVMDLSALRKWEVLGPDAETLLQDVVTRDVRRLSAGQVVYTALCDRDGVMVDDATVFRLARNNLRFVGGCESDGLLLAERARDLGLRAWVKPVTDELHNLAIQGPASRDTLAPIVWSARRWPELRELHWFRFLVGRIGGPQGVPVVVSRTGYTGELGYEIFCSPRDGLAVWDAVMEAGVEHGIVPLGDEALEMVRIEAGLIRAGHEFGADEDPFEAGIGFTVALDGAEGFTGSEALRRRRDHPRRALVGLRLVGGECPTHGDPVLEGRREVGVVTSAAPSPREGVPLAMARVSTRCAPAGTELGVGRADGRRRMLDATVCALPFYDPLKERPRA